MYRREESSVFYRAVARSVWERYRPRALELPVGLSLLRDPEVGVMAKAKAVIRGLAMVALLFGLQGVLAHVFGVRAPHTSTPLTMTVAVATLVIVVPLALLRIAEPEHVVRARLRRMAVIPLRRRDEGS